MLEGIDLFTYKKAHFVALLYIQVTLHFYWRVKEKNSYAIFFMHVKVSFYSCKIYGLIYFVTDKKTLEEKKKILCNNGPLFNLIEGILMSKSL